MSVLPIRFYGDPVLREKATPYALPVTEEVRRLAADMGETMYAARGVGLAGNQVGVAKRILVIDVSDEYAEKKSGKRGAPANPQLEVYLNAEIVESAVEDDDYNEGCLSMPGIEGNVWRPLRIRVKWDDLDGKAHDEWIDDFRARVLQHEIDHLNGVLFIDHLPPAQRASLAGKLNRLKQEASERGGA